MSIFRIAASLFLFAGLAGCQDSPEPLKTTNTDVRPVVANQKDQDEVKSPLVRRLLDMLDEVKGEGTDEERRLIRKSLMDADVILSKNLGRNALEQIRKANKKKPAFRVGGRRGPKVTSLPRKKSQADAKDKATKKEVKKESKEKVEEKKGTTEAKKGT